jgi:molybdopterin molybdotransferase
VVPAAVNPRPGQVRDINSYTLAALTISAGGQSQCLGLSEDNQEQLRSKIVSALEWADIVLLSGGSSAGQRDFTIKVFQTLPEVEILAHGVAISPGKPLIMARLGQRQTLWGLPGHAASALVCAEVFIRPLLGVLLGRKDRDGLNVSVQAILSRPIASAQGRRDYIRVRLKRPLKPGEPIIATPVMGKSGLITTLVMADGLIICPENLEGLNAGESVDVYLTL